MALFEIVTAITNHRVLFDIENTELSNLCFQYWRTKFHWQGNTTDSKTGKCHFCVSILKEWSDRNRTITCQFIYFHAGIPYLCRFFSDRKIPGHQVWNSILIACFLCWCFRWSRGSLATVARYSYWWSNFTFQPAFHNVQSPNFVHPKHW